jgi:hypothetical protein
MVSAITVAIGYMAGQLLSNVKIATWAKTEFFQIIISVFSVAFIIMLLNVFCIIDISELRGIFGITTPSVEPCGYNITTNTTVYGSAQNYISDAACFSHNAMVSVRYHLEAYTVLSNLNIFECSLSVGPIGFGCLFGYSGTSMQPLGGYSTVMSAMNVFFNSALVSYVSALNYLFLLMYIYKGFVLFFLPLGILFRSIPYLRTFGSLLISVALAFLVIYPLLLAIFSLMEDKILAVPADMPAQYSESVFSSTTGFAGTLTTAYVERLYFDAGDGRPENPMGAIQYSAAAFIAAIFLPSLALLATIASIRYISKYLGEEIDLSRIVQMV